MAAPTDSDLLDSIREILAEADLSQLTGKKVRKLLEAKFEMEFSARKKEIDEMLMKELAAKTAADNGASADAATSSADADDDDSDDGPEDAHEPVRKKARRKSPSSDSEPSGDEAVARRLQEAENGRRSRGAAPKKAEKKKRAGGGPKQSVYSKECLLSEELSKVLGVNKMARKDVVSAMWKIFRERNLQDPKNKQFVNCDDDLFPVFKTKRFKAFGMMKYLKAHIKDAHFVADADE